VACVKGMASLDELSQAADRAMYQAKQGGRNRVASVQNKPLHLSTAASHA
jgi:PleD family two-component response regulator